MTIQHTVYTYTILLYYKVVVFFLSFFFLVVVAGVVVPIMYKYVQTITIKL